LTPLRAWRSEFDPVQTILPEPKINVVVFGFFIRYTKPGNCSGRYSTPGKTRTIEFRSIFWWRVPVATTFSMLMNLRLPTLDATQETLRKSLKSLHIDPLKNQPSAIKQQPSSNESIAVSEWFWGICGQIKLFQDVLKLRRWSLHFVVVSISMIVFFVIVPFPRSSIYVEAWTDMVYLYAADSSFLMVKDVYVIPSFSWFPFLRRLRFTYTQNLEEHSWWFLLGMPAAAIEVVRTHEIIKLLVGSDEFKFGATFLAAARKNSIRHESL